MTHEGYRPPLLSTLDATVRLVTAGEGHTAVQGQPTPERRPRRVQGPVSRGGRGRRTCVLRSHPAHLHSLSMHHPVLAADAGPRQWQRDGTHFLTPTACGPAGRASAAASGKLVAGSGSKPARELSSESSGAPVAVPLRPLTAAEAAQRCSSQARGSIYDSAAGICCHFCRQVRDVTANNSCQADSEARMPAWSVHLGWIADVLC